jgi:Zn-dependent M28 family amino/carboxypeptidase
MRRSLWVLAVAAGAWATPVATAADGVMAAPELPATTAPIDAQDALAHVKRLTAPEMEGRGVLTPGLALAGDYIAARFRAMGLLPAGDAGSFFEGVAIPLPRRPAPDSALRLGGHALVIGRDFVPNHGSVATRALGDVVFAGYGISVPGGYDDYAGVDTRGKLVICLRYAPHYDLTTGKAADPKFTVGAALRAKADNAIRHGAIGIAIVDPPVGEAPPPSTIEPLSFLGGRGAGDIASFHLARAAVDGVLAAADGQSIASLRQRIDDGGRPASRDLSVFADFAVVWESRSVEGRNVVAVLPGSDAVLRDQAVLIGAHYDHLGRGEEGSSFGPTGQIHPGADDNASGTAAVLEIAEALSSQPPGARPRRSIMFVAFTGEEKGLIGSLALAAQAGARHVVAMLNLDMVGRMHDGALEIGGGPTAVEWEAIVNAANQDKLSLTFPKRVVPNSDHASFLGQQIPSLFLFTGLHGDYHRASDTADKINAEGIAEAARLALRIVLAVANRDQRLAFVAPQWTRMGAVGGAHGTTVRLGVMPDYQSTTGLRVSAVIEGGAGAEAGLKGGDVIDGIGGRLVTDIESYMDAMASFKGGDTTVVKIRRDGEPRELKVKFSAAEGEAPASPAAKAAPGKKP